MPQPISTPTMPGTTLSVMVMVVPMVQPSPAWTSGMMRIFESAKAGWSQTALICSAAEGSSWGV